MSDEKKVYTAEELFVLNNNNVILSLKARALNGYCFESGLENTDVAFKDKNGKELSDNALIGTGTVVGVLVESGTIVSEYTVVVPGDVNGNGKITAADARLILLKSAKLD